MSMLWAFERLFWRGDMIEAEQRELKMALEETDEDAAAPPTGTCRLCSYQGPEWYCPRCLADTMVAARRRRR